MTTKTRWTDEKIEATLKAYGKTIKNLNPIVAEATNAAKKRQAARLQRVLVLAGIAMFFVFMAVMLAGCTGDGSSKVQSLAPKAAATQAPTPSSTQIQVTETTPDVNGFAVIATAVSCNAITPAPTMALDATDEATGVVVKGTWPCE